MSKSRKFVNLRRLRSGDYRQRQKRDWYDYVMLGIALGVFLLTAAGLFVTFWHV